METNWDPILADMYRPQLFQILDAADVSVSNIKPSEWAEKNRVLGADVTAMPGPFSYENSPYAKPIVDCLDPSHPARKIVFQKGTQLGGSDGVIFNGIGWIIAEQPGNILFLVANEGLVKDSGKKVDAMIDGSGIRPLIHNQSNRLRNTKSGDTDKMKEFFGGYLKLGHLNHSELRQLTMRYGFIDDLDRMKKDDKSSGSTVDMIEARFTAQAKKRKVMYISTPELKENSNIEREYLKGTCEKWHIPCPCCGEFITFEWEIKSDISRGQMAGITWQVDHKGLLIPESVGYTCQKCDGFFDDSDKMNLIRKGYYISTLDDGVAPLDPECYSFHVNALYAATFMFGWVYYVRKWMEANPVNGQRIESKWKTFQNLTLGLPYEAVGQQISANQLQKNVRNYEIGTVPEKQSIADGNGRIVMITLGSDLNGKDDSIKTHNEDDARLDWEIVAHSETGATYSIDHGSIGTFINNDPHPERREKWTYKTNTTRSVWPVFQKIIDGRYINDESQKPMKIFISAVDAGHMATTVYAFVDGNNSNVVGLKGDDDADSETLLTGTKAFGDVKTYRKSSRPNLYRVATNHTKDVLAANMTLKWDQDFNDEGQPFGFMNFPFPSDGKYLFGNFFSHYEAEEKKIDTRGNFRWIKRSNRQNHMFDVRLYAMVARDIWLDELFKKYGIKNGTWNDYVKRLPTKKRPQK